MAAANAEKKSVGRTFSRVRENRDSAHSVLLGRISQRRSRAATVNLTIDESSRLSSRFVAQTRSTHSSRPLNENNSRQLAPHACPNLLTRWRTAMLMPTVQREEFVRLARIIHGQTYGCHKAFNEKGLRSFCPKHRAKPNPY